MSGISRLERFIRRQYSVIRLNWIIRTEHLQPSDIHRGLTKLGYTCYPKLIKNGYKRRYVKPGWGEITLTVKLVIK